MSYSRLLGHRCTLQNDFVSIIIVLYINVNCEREAIFIKKKTKVIVALLLVLAVLAGTVGTLLFIRPAVTLKAIEGRIDGSYPTAQYQSLMPENDEIFSWAEDLVNMGDSIINPYSANTYPYNYYYAMENGAVGFVGILEDYYESNEFNNEDYSYMGGKMKIPGLWITKNAGEKLCNMIEESNNKAVLNMSGSITAIKAGAVVGYLPGKSEETIMVQSHYDSSTPGGAEDASGTSVVLAMAKFFSQIPEEERELHNEIACNKDYSFQRVLSSFQTAFKVCLLLLECLCALFVFFNTQTIERKYLCCLFFRQTEGGKFFCFHN